MPGRTPCERAHESPDLRCPSGSYLGGLAAPHPMLIRQDCRCWCDRWAMLATLVVAKRSLAGREQWITDIGSLAGRQWRFTLWRIHRETSDLLAITLSDHRRGLASPLSACSQQSTADPGLGSNARNSQFPCNGMASDSELRRPRSYPSIVFTFPQHRPDSKTTQRTMKHLSDVSSEGI